MKLLALPEGSLVYVSGAISGVPNYMAVFQEAAKVVDSLPGLSAVTPAGIDPHPRSSHEYGKYMRVAVKLLLDCDAIYMLLGWEESPGSRLEHSIAAVCGMSIVYEEMH